MARRTRTPARSKETRDLGDQSAAVNRASRFQRGRGPRLVYYFYFAARRSAFSARDFAYFFWKRSTRPAVSINFCLPVKNGWQLEQISTRIMSPLMVERVWKVLPQAQCTV